jgi:hypothetical protein
METHVLKPLRSATIGRAGALITLTAFLHFTSLENMLAVAFSTDSLYIRAQNVVLGHKCSQALKYVPDRYRVGQRKREDRERGDFKDTPLARGSTHALPTHPNSVTKQARAKPAHL